MQQLQTFEETFKPGRLFMVNNLRTQARPMVLKEIGDGNILFLSLTQDEKLALPINEFQKYWSEHFTQTTVQAMLAWLSAELTNLEQRIAIDQSSLDARREQAKLLGNNIAALSR